MFQVRPRLVNAWLRRSGSHFQNEACHSGPTQATVMMSMVNVRNVAGFGIDQSMPAILNSHLQNNWLLIIY
jgi:hypothetical protein